MSIQPLDSFSITLGPATSDYLRGAHESSSTREDPLEAFIGTHSVGLDLLHDVQEASSLLSRVLPAVVDRKTSEVISRRNVLRLLRLRRILCLS